MSHFFLSLKSRRTEHYGPYYLRFWEADKSFELAEEHDAKHGFSRYKHIYSVSYFPSPLNIPEVGLSSPCTPISAPCDLAAFFCFIPLLFLFSNSRLLLSLECLLREIVCKGCPLLSASCATVIFQWHLLHSEVHEFHLYQCGCDGCAAAWWCMRTCLPLDILRGRGKVLVWVLFVFSPRTVKLRSESSSLSSPLSTVLQAMCEGCSLISTSWPERCIWLSVKSARTPFIQ